jgi:hypothetical protein
MIILCIDNSKKVLDNWTAIATVFSAIIAGLAVYMSVIIYKGQKLLSQRQLIVPLWEYISSLSEIDPKIPVTPDIIKAINTLELIAITCEGKMIDKIVIKRTFSKQYIKHFDNIKACHTIPGLEPKTGNDLLKENPATLLFYDELMSELKTKNRIT